MDLKTVLSIGLVVFLCGTVVYGQNPRWGYMCNANKYCVKEKLLNATENGLALEVCKITCSDDGNLWPIPTGNKTMAKTLTAFQTNNILAINSENGNHEVWLDFIRAEFIFNLNKMNPDFVSTSEGNNDVRQAIGILNITAVITSNSAEITLDTDESYTLTVTLGESSWVNVRIVAATYFGARHGLETLSQLVAYDELNLSYQIVNNVTIQDKPIFSYRGIMLDVTRNFMPIPTIETLIRAMSYNKMNIFHLHLTDTHSYPFQSTRPEMTQYGAYSSRQIYSVTQLRALVEYAKIRGVKIVAEFDAPAHVGNGWQWGESQNLGKLVVCENAEPWYSYCVEPPCGQLNLANENMYTVLDQVYKDYMNVFDRDLFHMGGDEVHFDCYNSSTEITDYMRQHNITTNEAGFVQLWSQFQNRARQLVLNASENANLTAILWTSHLTNQDYLEQYINKSDYIIQIWSDAEDEIIPFLLGKEYRTIFSNYDALYLDCGYSAWIGNGHNWCSPYKAWQTVYDNSPQKIYAGTVGDDAAQEAIAKRLILGGEAPMWAEQVDQHAVVGKIWPRAAALAERLWTNPATTWLEAERRMVNNRQRLAARGIQADRLQPEWCYQNEGQCPGPPSGYGGGGEQGAATSLFMTPIYVIAGLISLALLRA